MNGWGPLPLKAQQFPTSDINVFFWLLTMEIAAWQRLRLQSTPPSPQNSQAFYSQLSSQWMHWGEAGFSSLNMPLLRTVWAVWTQKGFFFFRTQRPSLPDINRVNDTLTDACNLEGFLSGRNVCFCSWNGRLMKRRQRRFPFICAAPTCMIKV